MRDPNTEQRKFYRQIGKRIKEVRLQKKLSQQKLAQMVGVSCSDISRWERGLQNMMLHHYQKLSEVLS